MKWMENKGILRFHFHKVEEILKSLNDLEIARKEFSSGLIELPKTKDITDKETGADINSDIQREKEILLIQDEREISYEEAEKIYELQIEREKSFSTENILNQNTAYSNKESERQVNLSEEENKKASELRAKNEIISALTFKEEKEAGGYQYNSKSEDFILLKKTVDEGNLKVPEHITDSIGEKVGYEAELVLDMKNRQLKQNMRYNGLCLILIVQSSMKVIMKYFKTSLTCWMITIEMYSLQVI